MVQTLGNWSYQVFTRYLHLSIDDRLMAQELIARPCINIQSEKPDDARMIQQPYAKKCVGL